MPIARDSAITSRIMSAVRSRDGKAEVLLRQRLHRLGFRYRVCVSSLAGKPDIVFSRARVAVFVDGDFWHGRKLREEGIGALRRSFRPELRTRWVQKLRRNVQRDEEVTGALTQAGWRVVRVWESDVLTNSDSAARLVALVVNRRRNAGKRNEP